MLFKRRNKQLHKLIESIDLEKKREPHFSGSDQNNISNVNQSLDDLDWQLCKFEKERIPLDSHLDDFSLNQLSEISFKLGDLEARLCSVLGGWK